MKYPVLLMGRALGTGGTERQLTETAKALDRSVFEPHVGVFKAGGMRTSELSGQGIPVVEFPITSFLSLGAWQAAWQLIRYIRRHKIRLVHTWDYPLTTFAIPPTRLFTSAVPVTSQRSDRCLIPRHYRPLIAMTDRLANAIVVNCDFVRRHLVTDAHVPDRKIRLCYNGIDTDRFQRVQAGNASLLIGTVCVLRPEKDLPTLMDAFARLTPGPQLAIVGSGPESAHLTGYAQTAGIAGNCHFEPATPHVTEWLSKLDIFVLPSRSEALSNSLMEAMACGCCVVASDVGGNPEMVRHGETGMLFPAGDAQALAATLQNLAADAALRQTLARNARVFIHEKFSIQALGKRMGEIYTELLSD
ncbi:MAG TPA: glycosyltransferase [Bryobacteraceae bacterium]|nr:glycosyltransferase [Bryobacteraceae bacterium]